MSLVAKQDKSELATLHEAVLCAGPDLAMDDIVAIQTKVQAASATIREIRADLEQSLIRWIEANGDIVVGDVRYYVGQDKRYKCRDMRKAVEAMLASFSVDELVEVLSSNAIKPGAFRGKVNNFDEFFTTEVKPDLKTGKPRKVVKSIDERRT